MIKTLIQLIVIYIVLFVILSFAGGAEVKLSDKEANKIVNAIERVENSKRYPFGIKSLPIKGNTEQERWEYARKIAYNTVINNFTRWQKAGKPEHCFLDYLASKYCPPSVDPTGHKNWVRNIHKMVDFKP